MYSFTLIQQNNKDMIDTTFKKRFMDKVMPEPNTGCWLWCGTVPRGYGQVRYKGKIKLAHRVSYELYSGSKIPLNYDVLHTCDVPSCVNPDHLFVGSHNDNMKDMVVKGRSTRGELQRSSKLTKEDVMEIRRLTNSSLSDIAERFKISTDHACRIRKGKHWKHLKKQK